MRPYSKKWNIVYFAYPPILRTLEFFRFHRGRQPFVIGRLKTLNLPILRAHLSRKGYEHCILAWIDTGEALSMRKVDDDIAFQYHIRVYNDGEVRGHYEYSSEGNPIGHILEKRFEARKEHFRTLLKRYI